MFDCNNIILSSLARVGDRVVGNIKENDGYKDLAIDGKIGTIFSFHHHEDYVPNFGGWGRKPGVYLTLGAPIVRWVDGTGGNTSPHDLAWWPYENNDISEMKIIDTTNEVVSHNKKNESRKARASEF